MHAARRLQAAQCPQPECAIAIGVASVHLTALDCAPRGPYIGEVAWISRKRSPLGPVLIDITHPMELAMGAPKHLESFDPARRRFLVAGTAAALVTALTVLGARRFGLQPLVPSARAAPAEHFDVMHSDAEWRAMLSPDQYAVLRQQGTERAFTSPLDHEKRAGTFRCAGCANDLFASSTKFDSGTGWPSFYRPLPNAVNEANDSSLGMERTEVHCRRCGGHLGHVFDDGPAPTGLRYCMNGVAMTFVPAA